MTSLDDLFERPPVPSNKRKLYFNREPNSTYKATKLSANGDVRTNGRATIEDEEDQDDVAAGPEIPPEEEEEPPDDEDGRFFGGGINRKTADVLDFIDERDKNDANPAKIDSTWLRKLALNFEKKISKNTELRAKFEDTPQKFMSSEADLDADIKALSILAEQPGLYEEFAKLGCVTSLVSLLSHDNTDIAIDAIEIINELTDEDVDAQQEQWDALVDAMLEADLLNLLYENITRMNEELESDRAGIYHILGVLENLFSRHSIILKLGRDTKFIQWLLSRIQIREAHVTQNKQYAAEILAILLQSSPENRTHFMSLNGIDLCLQLLSPYRKMDPSKVTEEEEYVENIFDCITCCVDDAEGKSKFLEAEGVELCLIMLREGKMSRPRALRLLDHSLGGPEGGPCCLRLVGAAGLKATFGLFMKRQDSDTTEHLLGILASMLRSLPANDASRIRLLAKFEEKNWRVINTLVQIRREVASRIAIVDKDIQAEKANLPMEEEAQRANEWLSRRLDAGLYVLQTADVILAWLTAEDERARKVVEATLADKGEDLEVIKRTLRDQLDTPEASSEGEDPMLKDMISTLVDCI
ncbi:MAG: hypothetical protein Q9217_000049 [Psora testacea]